MHQVNIAEAEKDLVTLVEEALSGEEVVITRDDRPLIHLEVLREPLITRRIGGAKGLVKRMSDDFGPYMPRASSCAPP